MNTLQTVYLKQGNLSAYYDEIENATLRIAGVAVDPFFGLKDNEREYYQKNCFGRENEWINDQGSECFRYKSKMDMAKFYTRAPVEENFFYSLAAGMDKEELKWKIHTTAFLAGLSSAIPGWG
ncbi:MAG: hypothetical protein KatS3mg083_260 [Candidatus Dojkabacteria bacterium]|nr:MAG: hypothetical protein KatS3mg083_260 [Candidatus Dojkabacteria bacterium]